jgi:hypothetical protein
LRLPITERWPHFDIGYAFFYAKAMQRHADLQSCAREAQHWLMHWIPFWGASRNHDV